MSASTAIGITQLSNKTKSSLQAQLWAKVDKCSEVELCQNMAFLLILILLENVK